MPCIEKHDGERRLATWRSGSWSERGYRSRSTSQPGWSPAPPCPRATARAALALGLVGLWMALLFAGHPAGNATHLLLLAALAVFPWRAARPPSP